MATSERWDILYEARREKKQYRDIAKLANLAVDVYNKSEDMIFVLLEGARTVPFGVMQGMKAGGTRWRVDFDPRVHPRWAEMATRYPGPALQQLGEINTDLVLTDPLTGTIIGPQPFAGVPFRDYAEFIAWGDWVQAGEYYRDSGGYWSNSEVERETKRTDYYRDAYKQALSWWLLAHLLNPGALIDYPADLTQAIQQIEMKEAGDVVTNIIMDQVYSPALTVVDPSDTALTQPLTTPGAPIDTLPGDFMSQYGEYLPYVAAGAVVLFALSRRRRTAQT